MTKITILVQAILAGTAIAAGGNRLQERTSNGSATTAKQRSGLTRDSFVDSSSRNRSPLEAKKDSVNETLIEQQLLDYFDREDESETKNEFHSSPRANPIVFIQNTIWKNLDDSISKNKRRTTDPNHGNATNQNGGVISSIMRRLFMDDNQQFIESGDDNKEIDDNEYNAHGYDFHEEELKEHGEELRTDDDGEFEPPSVSMPTESPTVADLLYWNDLDAYDRNEINDSDILFERPDNSIVLRLSLGVVNYEALSKEFTFEIIGRALHTMTVVLNENSTIPFVVYDKLDKSPRDQESNRKLIATPTTSSSVSSSDSDPQRELQLMVGIDDRIPIENSPVKDRIAGDHLADIYLDYTKVETVEHGWWQVSAIYSVWKNRRRRPHSKATDDPVEQELPEMLDVNQPVEDRAILKKVEGICDKAFEKAIENDVFWETLEVVQYGSQDLVMERNQMYYVDDKGIFDIQPVGCEYDMSKWLCPFQKPSDGATSICSKPDVGLETSCKAGKGGTSAFYGDDGINRDDFHQEKVNDEFSDFESFGGTYPDPIADSLSEIEWMTREWAGLGLMIFTIVSVFVFSVGGHFIKQRRMKQKVWGAALTHEGVNDFLEVGWKVYEQPQQEQLPPDDEALGVDQQEPQQQSQEPQLPQLFLQIYDKRREGYNDENSLLRGGVEQQMFTPATPTSQPPPNQYENNANSMTPNPQDIS